MASSHGQGSTALSIYDWMRAKREEGGAALQGTVHTYTVAMRAALAANMLPQALKVKAVLGCCIRGLPQGACNDAVPDEYSGWTIAFLLHNLSSRSFAKLNSACVQFAETQSSSLCIWQC